MKVIKTSIPDVLIFEPKVFGDSRGYFMESFRQETIEKYIGKVNFIQDNESFSEYGVLRGLHFQRPPFTQGKLVRVLEGEVLDVTVDIRLNSPTYKQHVAIKLSKENRLQLWIPRGFAHGFVVLSKTALFSYKCDNYYAPSHEGGVLWNDSDIRIDWLLSEKDIQLSDKDKILPQLSETKDFIFEEFNKKIYIDEYISDRR